MIAVDSLVAFFGVSLLLALVPGPDNVFVFMQSALQGRLAGMMVTLGLCTGIVVHTTLVSLGVAIIFVSSTVAFMVLKHLGAAYMLYLAWQAFHSVNTTFDENTEASFNMGKLYRRGIIMNVTNPKVSIFFLAFLPQFADPTRGSLALQMVSLGGLFIVSTLMVFGMVAYLAGYLGHWLSRSCHVQKLMNRVAGIVFVALALKIVTSER